MTTRLTLALVGERDERIVAHRAIEAALPLVARSLGVAIDGCWLPTDTITDVTALRGEVPPLVLTFARAALAAAR